MRKIILKFVPVFFLFASLFMASCEPKKEAAQNAENVIERQFGKEISDRVKVTIDKANQKKQTFSLEVRNNKIYITANSNVNACRAFYDYIKSKGYGIVHWSGKRCELPEKLKNETYEKSSPFKYHYYFNVVTHGYTTAFWDWNRWEREIDWMALHGINTPLVPGAHEAILQRVFLKYGFTQAEVNEYLSGPAFFPWNKMGNISNWQGNVPTSYWGKQIKLQHQILDRMAELGMEPIVPGFSGFVPKSITRLHPSCKVHFAEWAGFDNEYLARSILPSTPQFKELTKLYVQEWEKEFGKAHLYLIDSFNEIDIPVEENTPTEMEEISQFAYSTYEALKEANADAKWVIQGWTFPFHMKDGKRYWTAPRLKALFSKVPKSKLLILDLANEYNKYRWKIDPNWKKYNGFDGHDWVYSFIPNMGGRSGITGILNDYGNMLQDAKQYANHGNMVGFGFAPEGIENNEVVYELLSDVPWQEKGIDLNKWLKTYTKAKYGESDLMHSAWVKLNESVYNEFCSNPIYNYTFRDLKQGKRLVHASEEASKAVEYFVNNAEKLKQKNGLLQNDVVEFTAYYLGVYADDLILKMKKEKNIQLSEELKQVLLDVDKLLAWHPNMKMSTWLNYAKMWGDTPAEKSYYEANAKRLITTWGGWLNGYARKQWNGLIAEYYVPRIELTYNQKANKDEVLDWEEKWINAPYSAEVNKIENDVYAYCAQLLKKYVLTK